MTSYRKFSDIKNNIQPLDLIFFKATDYISLAIRESEKIEQKCGEFSHVGLVVNKELLPFISELKPDRLYIWESTISKKLPGRDSSLSVPDIETGKPRFGVQIRDLEEVFYNFYNCSTNYVTLPFSYIYSFFGKIKSFFIPNSVLTPQIAWCKLIRNPWLTDSYESKSKIINILNRFHTINGLRFYELNPIVLLSSVFPDLRPYRSKYDSFIINLHNTLVKYGLSYGNETPQDIEETTVFCSQFVMMIYQDLNIVSREYDPSNFTPMSFFDKNNYTLNLLYDPIYLYP